MQKLLYSAISHTFKTDVQPAVYEYILWGYGVDKNGTLDSSEDTKIIESNNGNHETLVEKNDKMAQIASEYVKKT